MGKLLLKFVIITGIVILLESCAPVFSELQSARTVGKNRVEIAAFTTGTYKTDSVETKGVEGHVGVFAAYGITDDIDLRLRYEYLQNSDAQIVGFGPKINVLKDKLSLAFPVGTALGKGNENTWEFHPTVLASFPLIRNIIELNISSKVLISRRNSPFYALNFGMAISSNVADWAVRPEYGILFSPTGTTHYDQYSIGLSYKIQQ